MNSRNSINKLKNSFISSATDNNFKEIPSMSLLPPKDHKGIWWINSAILPAIYDFQRNNQDVQVTQECLRTFRPNKKFPYYNPDNEIAWDGPFPYFHMQAAISDDLNKIIHLAEDFIESQGYLNKTRIYASSNDYRLINSLSNSKIELRIDSVRKDMSSYENVPKNESDYHQWPTFGTSGLHGRGADLTVKMKNNQYKHIGQIMEVLNPDNTLFGYTLGYGIEAFIRRQNSDKPNHQSFAISDLIDPSIAGATYLMDCVSTVCAMQSIPNLEQSSTNKSRHGALLRKEYRNLSYTCSIYNVKPILVNSIISQFCKEEFPLSTNLPSKVIETLSLIKNTTFENEQKLIDYSANIYDLVEKGQLDRQRAQKKIEDTSKARYPVPEWRKEQILPKKYGL